MAVEISTDLMPMNGHPHDSVPPIRLAGSERILARLVNAGKLPHAIICKHRGLRGMIGRIFVTWRSADYGMKSGSTASKHGDAVGSAQGFATRGITASAIQQTRRTTMDSTSQATEGRARRNR
jgi:hypothetical protein